MTAQRPEWLDSVLDIIPEVRCSLALTIPEWVELVAYVRSLESERSEQAAEIERLLCIFGDSRPLGIQVSKQAAEIAELEIPICPGCSEVNGTDGFVPVRHVPPLCRTSKQIEQAALIKELLKALDQISKSDHHTGKIARVAIAKAKPYTEAS